VSLEVNDVKGGSQTRSEKDVANAGPRRIMKFPPVWRRGDLVAQGITPRRQEVAYWSYCNSPVKTVSSCCRFDESRCPGLISSNIPRVTYWGRALESFNSPSDLLAVD
jgi:hypothetical protein